MLQALSGRAYLAVNRLLDKRGFQVTRVVPNPHRRLTYLDLVLDSIMRRYEESPTVVQVGANDGRLADPLTQILRDARIQALLIEPLPARFDELRRLHAESAPRIRLAQTAIGRKEGELDLFYIDDEALAAHGLPAEMRGMASAQRSVLAKAEKHHPGVGQHVRKLTVPMRTLASVLLEHAITNVMLLQVDTEGYDAEIVGAALDEGLVPAVIQFEFRHLSAVALKALIARLEKLGYFVSVSSPDDMLAVRADLASPFAR